MWLKKHKGGSSVGPHHWPEDGSVAEVPEHIGEDLLRIDPRGYEKVAEPPKPEPKTPAPKTADTAQK